MELLRQRVIVHLLNMVPIGSEARQEWLMQLARSGVLTRELLSQVRFLRIGALDLVPFAPAAFSDKGPQVGPAYLGPATRFEQEFERLERLGRGAFGEVWRCRHRLDGRDYAVKVVRYRTTREAKQMESVREAQLWAAMDHPHIARYHSAWVEVDWENSGQTANPLQEHVQAHREAICDASLSCATSAYEEHASDGLVTFRESTCEGMPWEEKAFNLKVVESSESGDVPCVVTEPVVTELSEDSHEVFLGKNGPERCGTAPESKLLGAEHEGPRTYMATLYIQTELCNKETLATWIAKRNEKYASGTQAAEDCYAWINAACKIFRQCVEAVVYLHERHCVHRDLKPSNVLFGVDGGVRLADFGLAKAVDGALAQWDRSQDRCPPAHMASPKAEHTNGVGTPAYASPEQLAGGQCGVQSDIYALGVILVELLTPLRTQMERAALLQELRCGRWGASGGLLAPEAAGCPATARLVTSMLSQEPAERPTAAQVLGACQEVETELWLRFGSIGGKVASEIPSNVAGINTASGCN